MGRNRGERERNGGKRRGKGAGLRDITVLRGQRLIITANQTQKHSNTRFKLHRQEEKKTINQFGERITLTLYHQANASKLGFITISSNEKKKKNITKWSRLSLILRSCRKGSYFGCVMQTEC